MMKYVLEFGCPRSGTTYLETVLDGLRNAQRVYDTVVPRSIMNLYANPNLLEQGIPEQVDSSFKSVLQKGISTFIDNRYNSRFLAFESWWNQPREVSQLWHVIRPGRRPHPSLVIYRSTHLSFSPSLAFESIPEARVIYLYRDGRDVANSLVESYNAFSDEGLSNLTSEDVRLGRRFDHRYVPWWVEEGEDKAFIESSQYGRAIWFWKFLVDKNDSYFASLTTDESDRLLKIRYEDLVSKPKETGNKICHHLEMDKTRYFNKRLEGARTSSIGKHKGRPSSEIEEATRIAEDTLRRLEYA